MNKEAKTIRKKGGAPRGNRNAAKPSKYDGQVPLRIQRDRIPRIKAATYITGDRGVSGFIRRLIEEELERVEAIRVGVIIDHDEAARVLSEAGHDVPKIPPGSNTAELWFETSDGWTALAINQTGFERTADDPEPVNGCTVLVAEGTSCPAEGRRAIEMALSKMGVQLS